MLVHSDINLYDVQTVLLAAVGWGEIAMIGSGVRLRLGLGLALGFGLGLGLGSQKPRTSIHLTHSRCSGLMRDGMGLR